MVSAMLADVDGEEVPLLCLVPSSSTSSTCTPFRPTTRGFCAAAIATGVATGFVGQGCAWVAAATRRSHQQPSSGSSSRGCGGRWAVGDVRPSGASTSSAALVVAAGAMVCGATAWQRRSTSRAGSVFGGRRGTTAAARGRTTARAKKTRVRLTENMPRGVDFYQVLGVDKSATHEEIRGAYKRIIRENHPDVNPDRSATERFIQAQEAFRWLSDPQQREVYDGVGSKFGESALYDYTDQEILGPLKKIQEIPILTRAVTLVQLCRKELFTKQAVKIDHSIKDVRRRFRKYGAQRIVYVKNYLLYEIRKVLQYPSLIRRLHPFERLSVELALQTHMNSGGVAFGRLMGGLKELRVRIHEEAAVRANAAANAERGRLATFIADQGIEDMLNLVLDHAPLFEQFIAAQTAMLKAPYIDLDKPTVAFVGAPNVGKSSIVRSLSTGRGEVNSYCYTTKQLTIGHIWHFVAGTPLLIHGQIVDTPGLRNYPGSGSETLMDQLTFGAMNHLPSAVVYCFDPYPDTHGLVSLNEQIELRNRLRLKFPKRPWIDVVTRVDLEESQDGIELLAKLFPDIFLVSSLDGTGLDELNSEVRRMLEEMTKVVRQLQRAKIKQLRVGADYYEYVGKEALVLRV